MQVSSISNDLAFNGSERRKKLPGRTNVDTLINLDDDSVKKIAYLKTISRFNEDKYKSQNRIMFGLIPVGAGIAAALNPMQFKNLNGAANRVMNGVHGFGVWAGLLAVGAVVAAGVNKLSKHSENYREFDRNNKFLSFLTTAAVAVGAAIGLRKGTNAILANPKVNKSVLNVFDKYGAKFNNNKTVSKVSQWASKQSAKMSSSFKNFVKIVAGASPIALLIGGFCHSTATAKSVNRDIAENYSDLKNKQIKLAQYRVRELAVQNDLLLLNKEANQEELGEFMHALRKGRALERSHA